MPLEGDSSGGSNPGPGVIDICRTGVGVWDLKRWLCCGDRGSLARRGERRGKARDSRILNLECREMVVRQSGAKGWAGAFGVGWSVCTSVSIEAINLQLPPSDRNQGGIALSLSPFLALVGEE